MRTPARSTLTYEVVWRGGGEEKTVVVDLGYGDGLLWLRGVRER